MSARVPAPRWPPDQAWEWYRGVPWALGFNYVPSTAANTTEFWQVTTFDIGTIERELGWAARIGFNSCRVFLPYVVWLHEREGFIRRVDRFLAAAAERGLTTVFCLFDDCAFCKDAPSIGPQKPPPPGMMMGCWTASPGHALAADRSAWPNLERYVRDVVGAFTRDERVLFWDLYNEPGNEGMDEKSLPLAEAVFAWARAEKPSQPLTTSLWRYDAKYERMNAAVLERSDVVGFHLYGDLAQTRSRIESLNAHGRPVICTEWMARTIGSRVASHLPMFKELGIGCYCWGLVNGRTQTHFPWPTLQKQGGASPEWFHDLLRADGTPYDEGEIRVIESLQGGRT